MTLKSAIAALTLCSLTVGVTHAGQNPIILASCLVFGDNPGMVATGVELIPSLHGGILSFETKILPVYTANLERGQLPANSQTWAVAQFNGGNSFKWIYPESAMKAMKGYFAMNKCQDAVETDVRGVSPTVTSPLSQQLENTPSR